MKRSIFLLTIVIALSACTSNNSLREEGLKGRVKSTFTQAFEVEQNFGELQKGDMYDDVVTEIGLYPACMTEYNSDGYMVKNFIYEEDGDLYVAYTYEYDARGNQTKFTSYDEDGDLLWSSESKYEGDEKVADYSYNAEGELSISWELVMENGTPVDIKSYNEYWEDDCNHVYEFDGYKVAKIWSYCDGETIYTENTYKGKYLYLSVTRNANGEIQSSEQSDYDKQGRLVYSNSVDSDGDETYQESQYNDQGLLVSHKQSNWWSDGIDCTIQYTQFDNHGNWTERVIYEGVKPMVIQTRNIEYYSWLEIFD
jgi:hypothetical protein